MLSLVVARAQGGAIGRDNRIPWHSPADLRMFQRETLGGAVIMGRRTWQSLPVRPLKERLNIVVSSDPGIAPLVRPGVAAAIAAATETGHTRLYGIGGAAIYREMLPLADRLLLTEVDLAIPDADAFFPPFDPAEWVQIAARPLPGDGPPCLLRELLRRR
jgi:dihydrofolate reductase